MSVVKVSNYDSRLICFSLQFYMFFTQFAHIVWDAVVNHIHVKDFYVFLENWPLYHCVMPYVLYFIFLLILPSCYWIICSLMYLLYSFREHLNSTILANFSYTLQCYQLYSPCYTLMVSPYSSFNWKVVLFTNLSLFFPPLAITFLLYDFMSLPFFFFRFHM